MFDKTQAATGRSTQSLLVSLAIHGALVAAVLLVHFTAKSEIARRNTRVQLIAPLLPLPARHLGVRTPNSPPQAHAAAKLPHLSPPVQPPAPRLEAAPVIVETPPSLAATIVRINPILPIPVQTPGFSTASAAPAQSVRTQVATAGFGDASVTTTLAARRTVTTGAGFGDADLASTAVAQRAPIRASGFGDAISAAPSAINARPTAAPTATAAQILEKPRPAYTEEARRLQIEGEVQLEILFGASGKIRILRVVHGLGHGLDENAAQAAGAIRYLPAKRDGRPVDSTATVHIIFQLAS